MLGRKGVRLHIKSVWGTTAICLAVLLPMVPSAFGASIFVDGNLIYAETLSVNESRTRTIYANKFHNFTHIKLISGQTYKFTVQSPAWRNGGIPTDAGGYMDMGISRRHNEYNLMALVGEIFSSDDNPTAYAGKYFLIGLGPRTWKASKTGYLVAIANDCEAAYTYLTPACYADNSGVVTLIIKRTA